MGQMVFDLLSNYLSKAMYTIVIIAKKRYSSGIQIWYRLKLPVSPSE